MGLKTLRLYFNGQTTIRVHFYDDDMTPIFLVVFDTYFYARLEHKN
jgi:hypothetical protein